MSSSPGKGKHAQWSATASDIQLKRCREHLKPYLYQHGILPDKMQADPHRVAQPHFQALAKVWGLHRKPDFSRKYALERDLGAYLVEHSAVVEESTSAGQRRAQKLASTRAALEAMNVSGPSSDAWKTTTAPYETGDLFASRGDYDGAILYMSHVGPDASVAGAGGSTTGGGGDSLDGDSFTAASPMAAAGTRTDAGVDSGASQEALDPSVLSALGGGGGSDGGDDGGMGDDKEMSLIELSQSSDVNLKRNCSGALLRLSHKPAFRAQTVQAGAIMALANMYNTPDDGVKSDSAEAMCNLVVGLRTQQVLQPLAFGVLFAGCTDHSNPYLQALCLGTLLKLLCCRPIDPKLDHHALLLDNGIVGYLRELSTSLAGMDDTVIDLYGSIVVELASRKMNHPLLVSDGLIHIANTLIDTHDAETRAPLLMDGEAGDVGEFGGLTSSLGISGDDAAPPAPAVGDANDSATALLAAAAAADPGHGTDLNLDGDDTEPADNSMDLLKGCCSQDRGAMVVDFLLSSSEFLYPLLDANMPKRVIDLANTKSNAVNTALRTLTAFAEYPESRTVIVKAGVLAPLVAKVRASGKMEGKVLAMRVIRKLCVDPLCQPQLVERGAVPALLSISLLGEKYLEEDSAVALCSLLLNDVGGATTPGPTGAAAGAGAGAGAGGSPAKKKKKPKNILDLGALGALNSLAKSDVDDLQIKAAATLADLAADPAVASKLVESGGLDTLVKLAQRENGMTLQYVAVALGNLSAGSKRLQRRLMSNGVVHMVCSIAKKVDDLVYPPELLEVKKNVQRDEKLAELTAELQESARRSCAAALGNLSYVQDMHIQFLDSGGLQALVALGGHLSAGTHTRISCATGLCNVSSHNSSRKKMIQLGCVPILVALGRSNPLEASKQDCARALSNLTCEVGEEMTIAKQGAAGGLVMMALFRSDSGVTKELCTSALYNLLCDPVSRVALMREEVVWSFTKLVSSDFASHDLRHITSRMLCALSCTGNARPVLLEQRAVPAITSIVTAVGSESSASYIRRTCAMTLRNLSFDTPDPFQLVRDGVVACVIELCTASEPAVVYQVACVLANLCTNEKCCAFVAENDAVAVLLQLCSSERPAVLRLCTGVLTNMSFMSTHQKRLVQERVVAVLVLCSDTKDYNQSRQAAQAFYNLTCSVDPEVRAGVVESGVARALVNLVNSCLYTKDEIAAVKAASGGKMKYPPALPSERENTLQLIVGGIANLSVIAESRARFAEQHTPLLLVRVLEQSRRASVVLFALYAMCNLTTRRADLPRFLAAGAMAMLLELSQMGVEGAPLTASQRRRPQITGADDPIVTQLSIRRCILRILMNLSHDVETRMRQTSDGLLEAAVALGGIVVDKDLASKGQAARNAAAAAAFSAGVGDTAAAGAGAGAGGAAADDDDDGDGAGGSDGSASVEDSDEEGDGESVGSELGLPWAVREELTETAVRVFWNVSRAGANATNAALLREGAVSALLTVCSHPTARIQNVAVVAVNNLSGDAPRRKRLQELGAVAALTRVVTSTRSNHTKDKATFALRNIAADAGEDASEDLVATGGVDMLVRLMMVSGGDAAASGVVDGHDGRRPKHDDPKTDTYVPSAMKPALPEYLDGISPGVGSGGELRTHTDDGGAVRSQWISVSSAPGRANAEPFVPAVGVEYEEARKPEDDDDSDDDSDDAGDDGEPVVPGDYPGPTDLDTVLDKYLWSRLGGGAMAETGLAAVRLIKEEQAGKAALAAAANPLEAATAPVRETSDTNDSDDDGGGGGGGHRGSWAPAVDARSKSSPSPVAKLTSPLPVGKGTGALRSGSPKAPPLKPVSRSPRSGTKSLVAGGVKPRAPGAKKTTLRLSPLAGRR